MRLYGFSLLLSWLILVSCNSGGESLVPPVIESISPTGIVGTPGDDIQFSAVVTGASGSATYAWTFGGGATPNTSSATSPTVVLGSIDTYSASLTVTDGETSDVVPFSFEVVDVPVIQSVTPTGSVGLPLGEVQFTAEILGSPTSFEWDLDVGALPDHPTDESPTVTLQNPGTYNGRLIATNGNGSSEPFPFEFTVEQPVAPTWTFVKVGVSERADGPRGLCAKVVDGHLVLAYNMQINDSGNLRNAIRYTRATVEMPSNELQFESHTVVLESDTEHPRLSGWQGMDFSEEGIPYLLFGTASHSPSISKLARANTTEPNNSDDWDVSEVEYGFGNTSDSQILEVREETLLAIIAGGSLVVFESTDLTPSEQADWNFHAATVASGNPLTLPYMQLSVDDRLQIVTSRPIGHAPSLIMFCQSSTAEPAEASDWANFAVDIRDVGWEQDNYLSLFNGLPVIFAPDSLGGNEAARLYFTQEAHPANLDDFTSVQISPPGVRARALGLTSAAGRLAALYRDVDQEVIGILRQIGTVPETTNQWTQVEVTPPASGATSPALLLTLQGRLTIVFVDPRDNRLTLAIADGEF